MNLYVDEKIRLEGTAIGHAQALFAAIDSNRVHLSRFLGWVDQIKTVDDSVAYLQQCEELEAQQKEVSFMIFYEDNMVGRIGLHHLSLFNKTAAVGYWLSEKYTGKGIMLKSCKKLIDFGFDTLNLNRIELKAATGNVKSQAIPKKLNFKQEGILRQAEMANNTPLDLIVFSVLKSEWQQL